MHKALWMAGLIGSCRSVECIIKFHALPSLTLDNFEFSWGKIWVAMCFKVNMGDFTFHRCRSVSIALEKQAEKQRKCTICEIENNFVFKIKNVIQYKVICFNFVLMSVSGLYIVFAFLTFKQMIK